MPDAWTIENIFEAIREQSFPSITIWNRLEGRPRSVEFGGALRVDVRDALWMLTRQWQLGEFRGDDAGSPVMATFEMSETDLDTFRPREGAVVPFDAAVPLEATVERRVIEPLAAGGRDAIDLRLMLGRRWLKTIPIAYRAAYVEKYGFTAPDPADPADADYVSNVETWATLRALAGRAMDGMQLYQYLEEDATRHPWDGLVVANADKDALDDAADAFLAWVDRFFQQPTGDSSWDPARLEHRFSATAPVEDGDKRLVAEEYPGGRLDWHAFSVDGTGAGGAGTTRALTTVIPRGASFHGMPHTRWWSFEDGRTNFGDISADTTDLARLLLIEFGLVYGNDWFLIPCELAAGTVARVEGLVVTNVFGERIWVEAAGKGQDDDWQRWSMYTLDVEGDATVAADTSLLLLPTVPKVNAGRPLENVMFVRDEVANLVWGIERVVPLPTGAGHRGAEVAADALAHRTRLVAEATSALPAPPPPAAPISNRVMTSVPEHWIPFVAVHVPGDTRQTQLQRAAMPRLIEGDPNPVEKVRPRTSLLREGLDVSPMQPYFVHEQEVPRAGTNVKLAFQRTRWSDGRVVLWLATHRQTGRGEASSNLAFDRILPVRRTTPGA